MPKIVWMYWDNPEMPPLIQTIQTNNTNKLKNWNIRCLHETSIHKYISKTEYPAKFDTLIPQHKSDWIRLALLSKYGGVWMDASTILNDHDALDKLYNDSVSIQSQFTGFSFKNYEGNSLSPKGLPLYVENWFIMAPIRSSVIRLWRTQYERAIDMGFPAYRTFLNKEGVDTSKIFANMSSVYLTQHGCLQYVFQKQLPASTPMIIMPAEHDMLKIRYNCNYDDACTMNTIKNRPNEARAIPYIKLVSGERNTGVDIRSYFHE